MTDTQDLVQAIRVAPFISADEARRRCREAAEEIERLAEERRKLCWTLRRNNFPKGADEIERLARENHILKLGMEAWPEILKDRDDRLAALAQSDAGPAMPQTLRDAAENLLIAIGMGWDIEGCVENLRAALVQSDTQPQETQNKQPPGPDSILHELGDCPTQSQPAQSNAEPSLSDQMYGFHGAGFNSTAPEPQSDAEPKNVRDMLEKAIIASTLPEHKATDAEFMRASIRLTNEFAKDALAALVRSNAEPVAWRNPAPDAAPSAYSNVKTVTIDCTAPLRPNASAGLIEAAEMAEQCANGSFSKNEAMYLRGFADRLRARAADRSGK